MAVYWLTKDKGILSEMKDHLESPEVALCLAMAADVIPDGERLEFANLYIQKKPGEMQGYMLAADILNRQGSGEKALEMVKLGITAEPLLSVIVL